MKRVDCDMLVIGSGPGGAMTACMAAEAGRDVLLVEEGAQHAVDSAPPFSLAEMEQKYRNAGLNVTFGGTSITYLEGRCVGGGSEINAALYHRPLDATLRQWQQQTEILGFGPEELRPHFEAVERDCQVSLVPGGNGPASDLLRRGAGAMGWSTREIARFWSYPADAPQTGLLTGRQSMSVTLLPRAVRAGARLMADTRVLKLNRAGGRVLGALAETPEGGRLELCAKEVVVCAGAVQTPRLLRRSGFTHNVGDTLQLHPMIRITARFKAPFNDVAWGVPTEQVDEFKPGLTLGCSYSSIPHLALWMGAELGNKRERLRDWRRTGIFYVAAVGTGKGRIRDLPVVGEPFIRLRSPSRISTASARGSCASASCSSQRALKSSPVPWKAGRESAPRATWKRCAGHCRKERCPFRLSTSSRRPRWARTRPLPPPIPSARCAGPRTFTSTTHPCFPPAPP